MKLAREEMLRRMMGANGKSVVDVASQSVHVIGMHNVVYYLTSWSQWSVTHKGNVSPEC